MLGRSNHSSLIYLFLGYDSCQVLLSFHFKIIWLYALSFAFFVGFSFFVFLCSYFCFVLFSVLLLEDFLNYAFLKDNNLSLFHIIYSLFIFCWCCGFHCFDIVVIFTTVVIVVLPPFVVVVTAFVSFLSFSLDCLEELFSSSFFLLLS